MCRLKFTVFLAISILFAKDVQGGLDGEQFMYVVPREDIPGNVDEELIISTTDEPAQVELYGDGGQLITQRSLGPYQSDNVIMHGDTFRVLQGVENKAVYITSNRPVTITTLPHSYAGSQLPDGTLLRPLDHDPTPSRHLVTSYPDDPGCVGGPKSFIMIAPLREDPPTRVDLYHQWELVDSQDLSRYQVWTVDSYNYPTIDDFTGYEVVSDGPVAVYSGQGCTVLQASDDPELTYQYFYDSMPNTEEMGGEFGTFALAHGAEDSDYIIRVVAGEDDTDVYTPEIDVELDDLIVTLNTGEFLERNVSGSRQMARVFCTKPCAVTQLVPKTQHSGSSTHGRGSVMVALVPTSSFTQQLVFNSPEVAQQASSDVSITIITRNFPLGDIYLDGDSLQDHNDWQQLDMTGYHYLTLTSIDSEPHELWAPDPADVFTAYLHTADSRTLGYPVSMGYNLGYDTAMQPFDMSTPPTTSQPISTTREPWELVQHPKYLIILRGEFESISGNNFTEECNILFGNEFRTKAQNMRNTFNSMVGDTVCLDLLTGDVNLETTATSYNPVANTGWATITYLTDVNPTLTLDALYTCLDELVPQIQDFENWPLPIIPIQAQCPAHPYFINQAYSDERTGQDWSCPPSALQFDLEHISPSFSVEIYQDYNLVGQGELEPTCISEYTVNWYVEADKMRNRLSDDIASGAICQGLDTAISLQAPVISFNIGYFTARYGMSLLHQNVTFTEVNQCGHDVYDAILDHSNWDFQILIIPPPQGCPVLLYDTDSFDPYGEIWHC